MSATAVKNFSSVRFLSAFHVLLGSLYIALLAQIEIPLKPVPVTLHTFAIVTLALYMGKRKAVLSTMLYLLGATLGLPVFPSLYSDPLWILHPSAGFCVSFPFAAYVIGTLVEKNYQPMLFRITTSILAGECVFFLFGVSWLSMYVGWQQALVLGFYPFIFIEAIKIGAAASLKMGTNWLAE